MKLELSMFADLNSDEMQLILIKENSPKQFHFSFTTHGQCHHGIILTFHEDHIHILYYTETNEHYLNLLMPFVTTIKEKINTNPSFRLQMIFNFNYCKVEHYVPDWCSSDFKYNVMVDHFGDNFFQFKLNDSSISDQNNDDAEVIAVWSYEDGKLEPINFFRDNPPLYLTRELMLFTTNYIQKADHRIGF
jgi:hypothetical protein